MHYHVYYCSGIAHIEAMSPKESAELVAAMRRNRPHKGVFRVVIRPKS